MPGDRRPYRDPVSPHEVSLVDNLPETLYCSSRTSTTLAMTRRQSGPNRTDILQGTLDMLILRTLLFGPVHGHGIATSIEKTSDDVLQVDHGSLYPALQRLQAMGWIKAKWGLSENNRKAKYYSLTAAGKKQLSVESSRWERLTEAMARIMRPAKDEI